MGSTSITMNTSGVKAGEMRNKAFGETRYTFCTTPTKRHFHAEY
jgi:hypothetical protein